MTPEEYQEQATQFLNPELVDEVLVMAALGLSGESAEVGEHIKKWRFQGHPINEKAIAMECGDVLWYLCMILSELSIPLEDVMKLNIEKLSKRYPNGFTPDASMI